MELAEGTIIADRYRVETVLGRGGMGVVVAARHLGLDERVAIKFLLREDPEEPLDVTRFLREAKIAAKLRNEHAARVHDVGTLPDGTPYLVMEYLAGQDLGHYLAARKRLPINEAVDFVLQACEALSEAHAMGVVHRDLKPSNLFLARRHDGTPLVKVLDFGVSKIAPVGGLTSLTRTSDVIGSPLYMSPEQMISAKHVDARTDIWALGVILFELLMGDVPWLAGSLAALCARVLEQPVPSMREKRPEIPAELEAVVIHCLEKNAERRMPNVGALARALAPFGPAGRMLGGELTAPSMALGETTLQTSAPAMSLPGERTIPTPAAPVHTVGPTLPSVRTARTPPPVSGRTESYTPAPTSRRPASIGLGLAISAGLAALVTGAAVLLRSSPTPTPTSATAPPPSASAPPAATSAPAVEPEIPAPAVSSATPAPSTRRPVFPAHTGVAPPRPTPAPVTTDDFGSRHLAVPVATLV